ncbi:MAG: Fic family protein [Candidatus Omnitrophota bacterium]|nr:Fic family protein [Candidatus Omnitrophota bacterium]
MKYIWEHKSWFDFKYDNVALLKPLSGLRVLQGKLLGRIASLDIKLETEAQGAILVEEAVRTAEIEGQKLNRETVRSSVAVKLGLPHGIGTHDRNVDGLVDVLLDAVRFHDKPLTMERLNSWHAALFPAGYSGLRRIRTGKPRGDEPMQIVSGPIGKEKVHFEALPKDRLDEEMRLFLKWWNSSQESMDGILRAAMAHLRFLTIHPYEDGNGRLARALTDMVLAQDEKIKVRFYSVSSEIMRSRDEYYKILENVQRCRLDVTEWFLWFIKCVTASIEDSRDIIAGVFMKVDFWNQHAQDELNERQKRVINRILETGPGNFTGGLTTRKYVSIAKTSRATAFREISGLLDKKILRQLPGKGRSVRYDLVWPQVDK